MVVKADVFHDHNGLDKLLRNSGKRNAHAVLHGVQLRNYLAVYVKDG
ncbi:MAG: hypothetical protein DDT20_01524 [Firmicutes bacterium]|nr:hypothetical protein [Bacillota bacterium]